MCWTLPDLPDSISSFHKSVIQDFLASAEGGNSAVHTSMQSVKVSVFQYSVFKVDLTGVGDKYSSIYSITAVEMPRSITNKHKGDVRLNVIVRS